MSGGLEIAGDAISGALLGRAVEPAHGEAGEGMRGDCLNCGAALAGRYCHQCGQAGHVHRTLGAFWHDFLHGVLHFEGKIWATLPLLAWRPGELTRRYVHGERARFISPLALFLFCVFLSFAAISTVAGDLRAPKDAVVLGDKSVAEIDAEIAARRARVAPLKAERDRLRAAHKDTAEVNRQLQDVANEMRTLGVAKSMTTQTGFNANTGSAQLDAALAKAKANPDLVLYKLQSGAYKYSWALIPLSTPFLWVLFFWRRDLKLYDHAVFVTYSLSFMLLLVAALTLLGAIGLPEGFISVAALLIPPVHIYRQLRGAYGSRRASALVRTAALLVFGFAVLLTFVILLLVLGVLG